MIRSFPRRTRLPALATLLAAALLGGCDRPEQAAAPAPAAPAATVTPAADTVYTNARVYTVDAADSWAEAFAVKDGKFVAVGSGADIAAKFPGVETVDLGGRMVMPGIADMHAHLAQAGTKELFECGFPFTLPIDDIVAKVKSCVDAAPGEGWLRGGQWAMELLDGAKRPHRALLDAVAPDRPLLLLDSTVHAVWVNSKALETLGIGKDTPNPTGGVIERDAQGEATGILYDNAAYSAIHKLPVYSDEQMTQALAWSVAQLNREGVTAIKDAMVTGDSLRGYAVLDRGGKLDAHIVTSLAWRMAWAGPQEGIEKTLAARAESATPNVQVDFVKIMLDGIPPSQTAAVLEPYLEDGKHPKGHNGYLTQTPESLAEDLVKLDAMGLTVKIHATGDRSVRVALDAFEAARKANGNDRLRHEVSHAEMIDDADLPRFKALNVTAEMCPILWYPSPLHAAMEAALGKERSERFWPVKKFLESGALVIYGSDWPSVVPNASPWPGVEAMVTRQDPYGVNPGVLGADQALDLATVLRIFTLNGAKSMYADAERGSIEAGKSADFIVLDRNLFEIPPDQLGDTKVERTVFRGRTVYTKG